MNTVVEGHFPHDLSVRLLAKRISAVWVEEVMRHAVKGVCMEGCLVS